MLKSLFSLKLPAILLKKRIQHRCFPVNFVKFISTLFYRIPTAAASVNQQPKLKLNPQHGNLGIFQKLVLREKCPNTEFFLVRIFPAFGLNTEYLSVFSPNAGRYGPEKTPYLDTFHAVMILHCCYCPLV